MAKKHKVPKIYKREIHRIPLCSECGEKMVKFRGKWLCPDDMKIKIRALPGWDEEEVSFKVLYPNREYRRQQ